MKMAVSKSLTVPQRMCTMKSLERLPGCAFLSGLSLVSYGLRTKIS